MNVFFIKKNLALRLQKIVGCVVLFMYSKQQFKKEAKQHCGAGNEKKELKRSFNQFGDGANSIKKGPILFIKIAIQKRKLGHNRKTLGDT